MKFILSGLSNNSDVCRTPIFSMVHSVLNIKIILRNDLLNEILGNHFISYCVRIYFAREYTCKLEGSSQSDFCHIIKFVGFHPLFTLKGPHKSCQFAAIHCDKYKVSVNNIIASQYPTIETQRKKVP